MEKNGCPEYEYSEAVHGELERLIESATESPPTQLHAASSLRWRLMAAPLLFAILACAFVRTRTFTRPGMAKDPISSPKTAAPGRPDKPDTEDDVVIITSKQLSQITVEPVSETMNSAGHEFFIVLDSAVVLLGSNFSVIVEESAGRFRPRRVQTKPGPNGLTLIENGLRAEERIVTHGAILLTAKIRK